MSTPEIERGHRRMDRIERMLDMLESNPAPTVPQYDLGGYPGDTSGGGSGGGVIAVPNPGSSWAGVWIDTTDVVGVSLPVTIQFDVWVPQTLLNQLLTTFPTTGWLEWVGNFAGNDDGIRFVNRDWTGTVVNGFKWTTINADNFHVDSALGTGYYSYPDMVGNVWNTFYWQTTAGTPSHNVMKMNGRTIVDADYSFVWGPGDYANEYDWGILGTTGGGANPSDIVYLRNIQMSSGSFTFGPASSIEDFQGHSWSGVSGAHDAPAP